MEIKRAHSIVQGITIKYYQDAKQVSNILNQSLNIADRVLIRLMQSKNTFQK